MLISSAIITPLSISQSYYAYAQTVDESVEYGPNMEGLQTNISDTVPDASLQSDSIAQSPDSQYEPQVSESYQTRRVIAKGRLANARQCRQK